MNAPQLLQVSTTVPAVPLLGAGYGEKEKETRKASPALKAFAGSVGGLMEACTLQPIVRMFWFVEKGIVSFLSSILS